MSYRIRSVREDYQTDTPARVNWLDQFADSLNNKTAVEVARTRQSDLVTQISSIIGGQTVESKVQELQERTGLKSYLQRLSAPQTSLKVAQVAELFPNLNNRVQEKILIFIKNMVDTHRGLIPIPAVQEEILSIFRSDGVSPQDINTPEVAKYISDIILDIQKRNPPTDTGMAELGKGVGVQLEDDGSNTDFFKNLLPAPQG